MDLPERNVSPRAKPSATGRSLLQLRCDYSGAGRRFQRGRVPSEFRTKDSLVSRESWPRPYYSWVRGRGAEREKRGERRR